MHFVLSHAPQDCMPLILLFYGVIAALASFTAYADLHHTLSLLGSHTNNFLSFVFRLSGVYNYAQATSNYLGRPYFSDSMRDEPISFLIASLIFYFTSRVLLPVVIFCLVFSRPILSNPASRLCLSLRPNSKPTTLYGRSRHMLSSLNSVNTYDQHLFEFNHDFHPQKSRHSVSFLPDAADFSSFSVKICSEDALPELRANFYAVCPFTMCISWFETSAELRRCANFRKLCRQQ